MMFGRITLLELPAKESARELLKRACAEVSNVMKKRKWYVEELEEFLPENDGLHGTCIEKGKKIQIRLRRDVNTLWEYEHILGTLLHELCHIEINGHGQKFDELLEKLYDEIEETDFQRKIKGVSSNSFTGESRKLGGSQREKVASLRLKYFDGGSRKLGGLTNNLRDISQREKVALLRLKYFDENYRDS